MAFRPVCHSIYSAEIGQLGETRTERRFGTWCSSSRTTSVSVRFEAAVSRAAKYATRKGLRCRAVYRRAVGDSKMNEDQSSDAM